MSGPMELRLERARAQLKSIDTKIAGDPTNAGSHWFRGAVLASMADFPRALEALEKAVALLPDYADAWVTLGEIHAKMGDRKSAKRAFRTAIEIEPLTEGAFAGYKRHAHALEVRGWLWNSERKERQRRKRRQTRCPEADKILHEAIALAERQHVAAAIAVLRRGLSRYPGYLPFIKYLGGYLVMHGNREQSRALLEKMVDWWPEDAQAHLLYGVGLMILGEKTASVAPLERALELDPDNPDIRLALASAGGAAPPPPNLMITRGVFDSYAERFDSHLVETLEYRVPEKLAAIFASRGRIWDRALDLGCGTGLTGASVRPYARHLTGVDLSLPMIEKAKARGIYDLLYQGDCVAFLNQVEGTYDLMMAADVLVYFGDLTELFRTARARLTPGGAFWFSVEECAGDKYSVMLSQRYQHSLSYIRRTAEAVGYRLIYEQQIDIRQENRTPVRGLLVAIERPDEKPENFSGDTSWQFKPGGLPT